MTVSDDLLGKVRHEKYVLLMMRTKEVSDVPRHLCPTLRGAQEHFFHVVGVKYRHTKGNQADDRWVERVHVIHVEDVIKSQEDHIPGVFNDIAQAIYLLHLLWKTGYVGSSSLRSLSS